MGVPLEIPYTQTEKGQCWGLSRQDIGPSFEDAVGGNFMLFQKIRTASSPCQPEEVSRNQDVSNQKAYFYMRIKIWNK